MLEDEVEATGKRVLLVERTENQGGAGIPAALQQALTEQGVAPLSLRVERVAAIPKAASGKAPLIHALRRETAVKTDAVSYGTRSGP